MEIIDFTQHHLVINHLAFIFLHIVKALCDLTLPSTLKFNCLSEQYNTRASRSPQALHKCNSLIVYDNGADRITERIIL